MKKIITCLLTMLGLNSACGQQGYENVAVNEFDALLTTSGAVLLDVRTAEEFAQGHLSGAINIDVKGADFLVKVKQAIPADKTVAVYCRSGRRSANAASLMAAQGYKVVNLTGGIEAWKKAGKAVTTNPAFETDTFVTPSGRSVTFYSLMHGSLRIVFDGKEIEIDPVRRLGDRTVDYAAMPKADYIFVTHEHADHFDRDAIKILAGEKSTIVTNRRCADMMGQGMVMANGDTTTLAPWLSVEAVPAYNTTDGHLQFHPKGRDNGFVLNIDGLRVYVAGDTEDIPEMASIGNVDVAFLPCNQPYTMTPDQLVNAARMVKPRVLFPYHYGQTDVTRLPGLLKADGIDVRIRHYE